MYTNSNYSTRTILEDIEQESLALELSEFNAFEGLSDEGFNTIEDNENYLYGMEDDDENN